MSIIGIDFGTAFSFPSFIASNHPCALLSPSKHGTRGIPSVFYYDSKRGEIVGTLAESYLRSNPENSIRYIKRLLINSAALEYDSISLGGREFTKQEICSRILAEVVKIANKQLEEDHLATPTTEVVLTIPVTFGHGERELLRRALETPVDKGGPGVKLRSFIPEPVAAAIDYAEFISTSKQIVVFDLGAGTLDITLLEPTPGKPQPYRVVFSDGIGRGAAGNDFDIAFSEYILSRIRAEQKIDLQLSKSEMAIFLDEVRNTKEKLSEEIETFFDFIYKGNYIRLEVQLNEFEKATQHVLSKSMSLMNEIVKKYNLYNNKDINVILVGGSSRIRKIRTGIQEIFGSEDNVRLFRPEQSISFGAARYSERSDIVLQSAPHSYGVKVLFNSKVIITIMIQKGCSLPTEWVQQNFLTADDDVVETSFEVYETDELEDSSVTCGKKLFEVRLMWPHPVPEDTKCSAKMRLTEDGTLELQAADSLDDKTFDGSIILSY